MPRTLFDAEGCEVRGEGLEVEHDLGPDFGFGLH